MKKTILMLCLLAASISGAKAQSYTLKCDLPYHPEKIPYYSDAVGHGFDVTKAPTKTSTSPFYYSVKVPDGNYRVRVTIGSKHFAAQTVVRAENRRLFLECTPTRKGELKTYTFVINKRSPRISDTESVKLKPREHDYLDWDDRLTLEFNGPRPAVAGIEIEPDTTARTLFLCGNSTVVDQMNEPWASWGQMITRWFDDKIAISNHAESGLTATTFIAQNRLDKVMTMLKPGDYVLVEFGHNDQKEKFAGAGAYYNFAYALKQFIDRVRKAKGNIVFVTPTQRRFFDDQQLHIMETHGDYPNAMRQVAQREHVPVIELHDMTRTFFETLGYENSKRALVHYPMGTFPGQQKELADNTHFNPYGAYEVAKMVVMGMKACQLPVTSHLLPEWKDFSLAHPDDWKTFKWYPAPFYDNVKPDGN